MSWKSFCFVQNSKIHGFFIAVFFTLKPNSVMLQVPSILFYPSHEYSLNKMLLRTSKYFFGNKDCFLFRIEESSVAQIEYRSRSFILSYMIPLFPPLSSHCPPLELFIHYSLPSASCCSPPSLILSPFHRSFSSEVSNILRKESHVQLLNQANKNTVIIKICVRSFYTEIKQEEYDLVFGD